MPSEKSLFPYEERQSYVRSNVDEMLARRWPGGIPSYAA